MTSAIEIARALWAQKPECAPCLNKIAEAIESAERAARELAIQDCARAIEKGRIGTSNLVTAAHDLRVTMLASPTSPAAYDQHVGRTKRDATTTPQPAPLSETARTVSEMLTPFLSTHPLTEERVLELIAACAVGRIDNALAYEIKKLHGKSDALESNLEAIDNSIGERSERTHKRFESLQQQLLGALQGIAALERAVPIGLHGCAFCGQAFRRRAIETLCPSCAANPAGFVTDELKRALLDDFAANPNKAGESVVSSAANDDARPPEVPAPSSPSAPPLRECPACGAAGEFELGGNFVVCSDDSCWVCGPSHDRDGSKWNALPRQPSPSQVLVDRKALEEYRNSGNWLIALVDSDIHPLLFARWEKADRILDASLRASGGA